MAPTLEIVTFRCRPEANREDLMAAVSASQTFLAGRDGFLRRDFVRTYEDGLWMDVVQWRDRRSAEEAAAAFMASEACTAFHSLIDPESVVMHHGEPIASWQTEAVAV